MKFTGFSSRLCRVLTAVWALIFFGVTLSGCLIMDAPPETQYYDLHTSDYKNKSDFLLNVLAFDNNTGYGQKMMIRQNAVIMTEIPYNKWIQSPGELISRHLNMAFDHINSNVSAVDVLILSGAVDVFDVDGSSQEFVLKGRYFMSFPHRSKAKSLMRHFEFREKVEDTNSINLVNAASKCVMELEAMVEQDVVMLNQNAEKK